MATPHNIDWSARATDIDYARVASLQFLGDYRRRLPVSMQRMMENALDWEHLPHVHASSFGQIECLVSGRWGWRAVAAPPQPQDPPAANAPPQAGEAQILELLVDHQAHYWATAILAGPAAGIEIHTQATALTAKDIEIEVRFYSAQPVDAEQVPLYYQVLREQYALLYDEDLLLMLGRQRALDERAQYAAQAATRVPAITGQCASAGTEIALGQAQDLAAQAVTGAGGITVETPVGRVCVRHHRGQWWVHSALCPHQLGPLEDACIDAQGAVTCPWHGYRFDLASGANLEGKCGSIAVAASVIERAGVVYLVLAA